MCSDPISSSVMSSTSTSADVKFKALARFFACVDSFAAFSFGEEEASVGHRIPPAMSGGFPFPIDAIVGASAAIPEPKP
ncbi:unnamed protein product [Linum trigynum]|uniref:Uncharacterized protein n=1 Tax=Linum trigynum TaxID=586398 RepID=A0AAV2CB66_9ROSI